MALLAPPLTVTLLREKVTDPVPSLSTEKTCWQPVVPPPVQLDGCTCWTVVPGAVPCPAMVMAEPGAAAPMSKLCCNVSW